MQAKNKDMLSPGQRVGEVISVCALFVTFGFVLYHQLADTGFFTDEFGFLEKLCIYGPLFLGMVAPIIRAVTGRRNPARPYEAFSNICLAAGTYWLLQVFPLDYTHLADALPAPLRFSLSWVADDIARIVLTLMIIASSISAIAITVRYLTFPRHPRHMPS
jgi:hypothetical protein